MVELIARANSLSCLLNESYALERLPEPFRMQEGVVVCVTYSEYTSYILSLNSDSNIKLMSSLPVLRSLASSRNPRLYNCYLSDIAFAILKELWYAENFGKRATAILPTAYDTEQTKASILAQSYAYCKHMENDLLDSLFTAGYYNLSIKDSYNMQLYQLAVALYNLSKTNIKNELNVVNDFTNS